MVSRTSTRPQVDSAHACADLATSEIPTTSTEAVTVAVKSLAQCCLQLDAETTALNKQIEALTAQACPELRQVYGVGPDTAATLLVALGDNPERIGSDAAFAKLCGVAPVEASSGTTIRHRLNRGGNRTPTAPCTSSALSDYAAINPPATTSPAAPPKAEPSPKSCAASRDTSPARSTTPSYPRAKKSPLKPLSQHQDS